MGIREGYTGYYPASTFARGGKTQTAKRAPEAPKGLEWVVWGWTDVPAAWTAPGYHPCGARSVQPAGPPCTQDPWKCRLLANKGEITVILL